MYKATQADVFVSLTRNEKYNAVYDEVHGRGHCVLGEASEKKYHDFIISHIKPETKLDGGTS